MSAIVPRLVPALEGHAPASAPPATGMSWADQQARAGRPDRDAAVTGRLVPLDTPAAGDGVSDAHAGSLDRVVAEPDTQGGASGRDASRSAVATRGPGLATREPDLVASGPDDPGGNAARPLDDAPTWPDGARRDQAPARRDTVGAAASAPEPPSSSPARDAHLTRPFGGWRPATLVKKKRVREAAAKLLSRATIHAVTPEDVSLAAGLTKSSCYYYYGTRDALLADVLTEHLVALDAAVCAAFDATLKAEASVRMTALAYAFLRVALAQRDAHLALRLNAKLVSDARRPSVMARSRQVTATLRTALEACVPGLDGSPAMAGLLMRQFVGGLSEAVTWFKPDSRMNRRGLAQLIACQVLMTARAMASEEWVLPPPAPLFERDTLAGIDEPDRAAAPDDALPGVERDGPLAAAAGETGWPRPGAQAAAGEGRLDAACARMDLAVGGDCPDGRGGPDVGPGGECTDVACFGLGATLGGQFSGVARDCADAARGLVPGRAGLAPGGDASGGDATDGNATGAEPRSSVADEAAPEPPRDAIWLTSEQARRSLTKLVRAAGGGTEVVLTYRGVPTAKLVPATRERQRMRGVVGGRLG